MNKQTTHCIDNSAVRKSYRATYCAKCWNNFINLR